MAWIKGASVVVGTDSAAIHIAAGFDVPTLAFFVSIDPQLRTRDYPACRVVDARTPLADGVTSPARAPTAHGPRGADSRGDVSRAAARSMTTPGALVEGWRLTL